jgi:hypothetical protein
MRCKLEPTDNKLTFGRRERWVSEIEWAVPSGAGLGVYLYWFDGKGWEHALGWRFWS